MNTNNKQEAVRTILHHAGFNAHLDIIYSVIT